MKSIRAHLVFLVAALFVCVPASRTVADTDGDTLHRSRCDRLSPVTESDDALRERLTILFRDREDVTRHLQELFTSGRDGARNDPVPQSVVAPLYSQESGPFGSVVIAFLVDQNGTVEIARVFESSSEDAGEMSRQSVLTWRFAPATMNGRAVKCLMLVVVRFEKNERQPNQALQTTSVTRSGSGKVPDSDRQRRGV
jgi:hypothetical protein